MATVIRALPTGHGSRWDETSEGELRQRAEAGEMLPAIARAMGRTQEAVRSRANILGVPVRTSAGRQSYAASLAARAAPVPA